MKNRLQTTYLNPGIVSAESSLCATIHWYSSRALTICLPQWVCKPESFWFPCTEHPLCYDPLIFIQCGAGLSAAAIHQIGVLRICSALWTAFALRSTDINPLVSRSIVFLQFCKQLLFGAPCCEKHLHCDSLTCTPLFNDSPPVH